MRISSWIVYVLVFFWALVVCWSLYAAIAVDGPRNMDTGLRKLDVLVRWQIIAACLAILSALCGFLARPMSWRTRIVGLLPGATTGLAVLGLVGFVMFADPTNDAQQGADVPKTVTKPVH